MKSTREYIAFFLILLILTPFTAATGSEPTNGGDSDISIFDGKLYYSNR